MIALRLTQMIAANQIAGALWVALATTLFGAPRDSPLAAGLGVVIGIVGVASGVLALRGSRAGTRMLAAILALQIFAFANSSLAWQLCLGANWRIMFQPRPDATVLGFEGLFSITPWPVGGGGLFEINITALLASAYLLTRLYRTRAALGGKQEEPAAD